MSRERSHRNYLAKLAQADITEEIKEGIIQRQKGNCFYCDKPIIDRKYVLDHVIPRNANGSHGPDNRVAAHTECDRAKGGRLPTPSELEKLSKQIKGE